jgi:hypothetical protein
LTNAVIDTLRADFMGLSPLIDNDEVFFALWTLYYCETALSVEPKFDKCSLFHPFSVA